MHKADGLMTSAGRSLSNYGGRLGAQAHARSVVRGSERKDLTRQELWRARVRRREFIAVPGPLCGCGCVTAVRVVGMFRKARRVNVRKRNDSEEEERERDEEQEPPPLLPPPATGEEPGPGGGDRAPGGESLLGPGLPPPSALTPGLGAEAGGGFPSGAEPGNGLKPRKRPRENKEVPRASLLSFQDEEEGNRRALGIHTSASPAPAPSLVRALPGCLGPGNRVPLPARPSAGESVPPPAFCSGSDAFPRCRQLFLNNRLLLVVLPRAGAPS